MFRATSVDKFSRFLRGDTVRVNALPEILATLDAEGTLDGMPFMPEMAQYCGRRFRVLRRVERVFLDHYYCVGRLRDTVLLEGLRCDGAAHDGCQMGCALLWKEAWLTPAGSQPDDETPAVRLSVAEPVGLLTSKDGRMFCQATELVRATAPLPFWDVRQYARDVKNGEMTFCELAAMFRRAVFRRLRALLPRRAASEVPAQHQAAPVERLNLQVGELVEVKSKAEIQATLDGRGRHRGLAFTPEMADYCGTRRRVAARVEKIIVEWSGAVRPMSETVTLEGVTCQGRFARSCPRGCYHLWREAWLRRVS
jgi:hypothetical protein